VNAEQAKKSADAIILAFATIGTDWRNASRATEEIVKILTAGDAAPVEREYRAGEWGSALRESYFLIDGVGDVGQVINCNDDEDKEYQARGNAFPTESIAKAAKAHADWWRAFDKIRDEAVGETARAEMYLGRITYTIPPFHIGPTSVERLGGEQKVIEMLNKGRVFRFTWGGQ